ncbi:amidohydrolase family protein [Acrocarpospora macrocephala]|uniref:4-oxalomesaconate hydratase n=1 Tax=Acrocarpospora macrocephala TaxID=150177 RepID=A0A5M3WSI7_9ACTN|nr:amidohydrolase family protein [Acrocarpospora macrocephala]GES11834.1 4-oxalomesaconate hydratase [Acrocarpospora macrocephala]
MQIIDVHGHISAPLALYAYQAQLIASKGFHGKGRPACSDEEVVDAAKPHVELLRKLSVDTQFISPRPFAMMHSQKPERIVHWYTEHVNDMIHKQVTAYPDVFVGVAGLPQSAGVSPACAVAELERCVTELGFVGCVLNPDPGEGDYASPPLGDEWWYPLYEKMVELDVPALIHTAACANPRESYSNHFITEESIAILSLVESRVFTDFPGLKLIVAHGGGSIPYQIGRWRAQRLQKNAERFDDSLRRLYFDTVLYSPEALELLLKVAGPDRCLFATEAPGIGSGYDPEVGRTLDDLKPVVEGIGWLTAEQREAVFHGNARTVFSRWKAAL